MEKCHIFSHQAAGTISCPVENNIKHYLKYKVRSKSFFFPLSFSLFPHDLKVPGIFFFIIISTKHPFSDVYKPDYSKHQLLGYSFLLHQPFQPFIPSSSPWYLMLKLHRTAHCSPNTPSLPGLVSITYPVPSAGNAVSPHSPAFPPPPAHLSRCAANLTFTCYMCCHPSTNPVAY